MAQATGEVGPVQSEVVDQDPDTIIASEEFLGREEEWERGGKGGREEERKGGRGGREGEGRGEGGGRS